MLNFGKFGQSLKKIIPMEKAYIDGPIFNLHCTVTASMLFFAGAVVSTKELAGRPILCVFDGFDDEDQEKVAETFCWINSTFSTYTEARTGRRRTYYHAYYQWVYFVLLLQAAVFYVPKWLWRNHEWRLMEHLRGDDFDRLLGVEARKRKKNDLAKYFVESSQRHRGYTIIYWCCEFLCLINVVAQTLVMDKFFNGEGRFLTYGMSTFKTMSITDGIFNFSNSTRMDHIFPMQTRCTFHKYGPSGGVQALDALCILVINSYNRYIFLVMWYWFLILIVLLVLLLLHRVLLVFSPWLRKMHLRMPGRNGLLKEKSHFLVDSVSLTDWWVLYSMKSNLSAILFEDLVSELYRRLSKARPVECEKMLYVKDCSIGYFLLPKKKKIEDAYISSDM